MKKAILFGSTGFVGSYLLKELLNNSDYEQVTIVVRKRISMIHPKLKIFIANYDSLPTQKENITADEIFITLGTTQKRTPSKNEYYRIEHDYPVLAARLAKEKGAKSVFLVSAVGANAKSKITYVKSKGETERDIIALNFEHTHIFRPSVMMGSRKENRPFEKVLIKMWTVINHLLLGSVLNKYKGIDGKNIAKAMNNAAKNQSEKVKIYHWKEMNELLNQ